MFQGLIAFNNIFYVGNPGHGSRFIKDTAAEKVQYLTNKLLGYREEQKKIFLGDPEADLGEFTTVNLTYMSGGVQMNVVPMEFIIGFDMRISPKTDLKWFEEQLSRWCQEVRVKARQIFILNAINLCCRLGVELRLNMFRSSLTEP